MGDGREEEEAEETCDKEEEEEAALAGTAGEATATVSCDWG